jgi:hypothetical protein
LIRVQLDWNAERLNEVLLRDLAWPCCDPIVTLYAGFQISSGHMLSQNGAFGTAHDASPMMPYRASAPPKVSEPFGVSTQVCRNVGTLQPSQTVMSAMDAPWSSSL